MPKKTTNYLKPKQRLKPPSKKNLEVDDKVLSKTNEGTEDQSPECAEMQTEETVEMEKAKAPPKKLTRRQQMAKERLILAFDAEGTLPIVKISFSH